MENKSRQLRYFRLDRGLPDAEGAYQLLQIGSSIFAVIEDLRQVGPRYELAPGENLLCFHIRLTGEFITSIGMPDPVRFTESVGYALSATLLGLCIAVVALIGNGFLQRRIDKHAARLDVLLERVLANHSPAASPSGK